MIMSQPPEGYDAVIGEPGKDLNYDECIGECISLCHFSPTFIARVNSLPREYTLLMLRDIVLIRLCQNEAIRPLFLVTYRSNSAVA